MVDPGREDAILICLVVVTAKSVARLTVLFTRHMRCLMKRVATPVAIMMAASMSMTPDRSVTSMPSVLVEVLEEELGQLGFVAYCSHSFSGKPSSTRAWYSASSTAMRWGCSSRHKQTLCTGESQNLRISQWVATSHMEKWTGTF